MTQEDQITVICEWLGGNTLRAKEARRFFDELTEENTALGLELESKSQESDSLPCVSDRRGLFIAFAEYMDTDDPNEFQGLPYGDIVDNFFKARNSR